MLRSNSKSLGNHVVILCMTLRVTQGHRQKWRRSWRRASQNAPESSAKIDFVQSLIGALHNVVEREKSSMVGGVDYCRRGTDDAVVPRHWGWQQAT